MGEEENYEKSKNDLWVLDPIDGTIPFSHGLPICAFSLARVREGEVILGVAYDPFSDRLLFAQKNQGAFLNNQRIFVSKATSLERQVVGIETWSKGTYYTNLPFSVADEMSKKDIIIIHLCSIVYTAMLVAIGEVAGAYFAGNTAHDIAAVKLIVEEAGGKVTDLFGNGQSYSKPIKGAVISNGNLHDSLLAFIL
ncbi:MAG: inositol monophosphatase [Candidatus Pacebacteria bacterium]|nr:inositol monophosphatase [Candidatus Paceibacterota bacterium]